LINSYPEVVFLAAAGNDNNSNVNYPAGYNNVIGVGSVDFNDNRSSFSNYNSNFALRLESTLTMDDIKNNNVVFIGQFKTMNISSALFLKDSHVFSIYKDGFIYKEDGPDKRDKCG